MQIFLAWHSTSIDPSPEAASIVQRLQAVFAPLFETPPQSITRQSPGWGLAMLELPVAGWRPPSVQRDERTWALALDFPMDATELLREHGLRPAVDQILPPLCRLLQDQPLPALANLAPNFALCWQDLPSGDWHLQQDGLGFEQLFVYESAGLWAVSNRLNAFRALDIALEPDPLQWATRFVLDWFPMDQTGFKRIRFVPPGTRYTLSHGRLTTTVHDALGRWIHPPRLSRRGCLELAHASLHRQARGFRALVERASAGLTGGWDSRSVVASLRSEGLDNFSLRVKGKKRSPDVQIARQLAEAAGLKLNVADLKKMFPQDAERLRDRIERCLLWQGGYNPLYQNRLFLKDAEFLAGGDVNIMGQHGEIGRGFYASRLSLRQAVPRDYEARLAELLTRDRMALIRDDLRVPVLQAVREAVHQAHHYELRPAAALKFLYLFERTRRWASGSNHGQPGIVYAPFLNGQYIQAAFAWPGHGRDNPFHQFIVARDQPDWAGIPYDSPAEPEGWLRRWLQRSEQAGDAAADVDEAPTSQTPPIDTYWTTIGRPLIETALARPIWQAIFDPTSCAEAEWARSADILITFDWWQAEISLAHA